MTVQEIKDLLRTVPGTFEVVAGGKQGSRTTGVEFIVIEEAGQLLIETTLDEVGPDSE